MSALTAGPASVKLVRLCRCLQFIEQVHDRHVLDLALETQYFCELYGGQHGADVGDQLRDAVQARAPARCHYEQTLALRIVKRCLPEACRAITRWPVRDYLIRPSIRSPSGSKA